MKRQCQVEHLTRRWGRYEADIFRWAHNKWDWCLRRHGERACKWGAAKSLRVARVQVARAVARLKRERRKP